MKPRRAALYLRVSTGMQDEGLQRDDLRALAERRGYQLVREYLDVETGASTTRGALERLCEDARARRFDVLLFWKLDRLGRSLKHLLEVLDQLTACTVEITCLHDPVDTTTPHGRLLVQLLGAFAQFERDVIRERCMAGQQRARALGKHVGRPRSVVPAEAVLRAEIARLGSIRLASKVLKVSATTLRRRLAAHERENPTC